MNYYIDIELKPDAEFPVNVLLNKVYTKFHKVLFDIQTNDVGVSFPNYKVLLGSKLRIHGREERLGLFKEGDWLGGLSGYCQVSDIQEVPNNAQFRTVSRKQQNMTNAKLNRLLKRGSITQDAAKEYRVKMYSQGLSEGYLELESVSNGQKHRRYIVLGDLQMKPALGEFDVFGLSKSATIPWF